MVGEGAFEVVDRRKLRKFKVYRYNPDEKSNPRVDTYFIDANKKERR